MTPTADPDHEALERAWRPARDAGVVGTATIAQLAENAAGFLPAAFRVPGPQRAIDVGTGAGIPGIFLARLTPTWQWSLVDSNARRATFATDAVRALGLAHVAVHHARVEELAIDPEWRGHFDLVVARRFAAPAELAECAVPLLRVGGAMHVSVSESGEAEWRRADLRGLGAEVAQGWTTDAGRYLRVVKVAETPASLPRRTAARRRHPLF